MKRSEEEEVGRKIEAAGEDKLVPLQLEKLLKPTQSCAAGDEREER